MNTINASGLKTRCDGNILYTLYTQHNNCFDTLKRYKYFMAYYLCIQRIRTCPWYGINGNKAFECIEYNGIDCLGVKRNQCQFDVSFCRNVLLFNKYSFIFFTKEMGR